MNALQRGALGVVQFLYAVQVQRGIALADMQFPLFDLGEASQHRSCRSVLPADAGIENAK
jgi:hypothetical protein